MKKLNPKKTMIIGTVLAVGIILLLSINYRLLPLSKDTYPNYLKEITGKSINLTRSYQDEVALWNSHFYSNTTMAKITETLFTKIYDSA